MASPEGLRQPSNPSSAILQDMLREKKAKTHRVSKMSNGTCDRDIQSSPLVSKSTINAGGDGPRRSSGIGARNTSGPRGMTLKESEEKISKINKQNFDLKLEVYTLRERIGKLEEQIEDLHQMEAINTELQDINETLVAELEKRDGAVKTRDVGLKEAVDIISDHEATIRDLEAQIKKMADAEAYFEHQRKTPERSSPKTPEPRKARSPPGQGPPSIDRQSDSPNDSQAQGLPLRDTKSPASSNSPRRAPSFLYDQKRSSQVLRSLYLGDGANPSIASLSRSGSVLSGDDYYDDWAQQQMLNSPRLSVLSESGFSSIYGSPKGNDKIGLTQHDDTQQGNDEVSEGSPTPGLPSRNIQRDPGLQRMMEGRNIPRTPTPKLSLTNDFSSIDQVLERVPKPSHASQPESSPPQKQPRGKRSPRKPVPIVAQPRQRRPSSPTFGGPIFGGGYLPPTPDTMSTTTVGRNSSTPSIVTEKSLADRPHTSGSGAFSAALDFTPKNAYRSGPRSPVRPGLLSSSSDIAFASDSYAPIQGSRIRSYSSSRSPPKTHSQYLSPSSTASRTPTKTSPRSTIETSPRSAFIPQSQSNGSPELPRNSSFRSRFSKITKSTHPSTSNPPNIASRIFRRATHHNEQAPSLAPSHPITSSRPPVSRATSQLNARDGRSSSSLYDTIAATGRRLSSSQQHHFYDTSVDRPSMPYNPRRHSAVLDRGGGSGGGVRKALYNDDAAVRGSAAAVAGNKPWSLGRTASERVSSVKEGWGFRSLKGG